MAQIRMSRQQGGGLGPGDRELGAWGIWEQEARRRISWEVGAGGAESLEKNQLGAGRRGEAAGGEKSAEAAVRTNSQVGT